MRSEGFDVIILDAGNLLFKKETLGPGSPTEIAKATAEIIISGFNEIGCNAFSPGSKDFAGGLSFVQKMQSMANFPFISANIQDINGNRIFDPYIIVDSDDLSLGIIGLASPFNNSEVYVQNPIEALSEFINEVDSQVDIIILLFDSEEADLTKLNTSNFPIDLIVRSKAKTQSSDGGNKNVPAYSCGDRGKYLYQFDLHYVKPDVKFIDIAFHEKQISRSQKKLNKMKQNNVVADLRTMYKDDPITLKKIDTYESQIKKAKNAMANSINTITMEKHALDKNILDRPDILNIIDTGKSKRDELYGPLPPINKPPGNNQKHIRHDHDGDGTPDH
jgi:2',3'-cyclic-nucleotide 2'-phosphodiesterase (5'-nucleotidase family)